MHEPPSPLSTGGGNLFQLYEEAIGLLVSSGEALAHPLGFQFLPLRSAPDGSYVRLHLWERSGARLVPHTHSSIQESLILAGIIRNILWQPLAADDSPGAPTFSVHKDAAGSLVRRYIRTGTIHAMPEPGQLLAAGDCYQIAKGTFHTTECVSPLAVTLVARGRSDGSHAIIIGRPARNTLHYSRIEIPSERRERLVRLLLDERSSLRL